MDVYRRGYNTVLCTVQTLCAEVALLVSVESNIECMSELLVGNGSLHTRGTMNALFCGSGTVLFTVTVIVVICYCI